MTIAERNKLWSPDDLLDLLSVEIDGESVGSDIESGMIQINQAGRLWLIGDVDTEYYCDVLAQFGIDPYPFLDEVDEHIDTLIRHG